MFLFSINHSIQIHPLLRPQKHSRKDLCLSIGHHFRPGPTERLEREMILEKRQLLFITLIEHALTRGDSYTLGDFLVIFFSVAKITSRG